VSDFENDLAAGEESGGADDDDGWSPERGRLLGALIEKALTTPQNYPLSLNALTLACNQTTSRDPITDLGESEVERLLTEAKTDGLARFVHPRSGRGVTKYRHVVDEVFGLEVEEVALIGVLLLRGPQTVNELRTRTERGAGFADNDAVEAALAKLAGTTPWRDQPLVERLDRETGRREVRWIQLLCPAQGRDRAGDAPAASPRRSAGSAPHGVAAAPEEVAELRSEVAGLRAELAELRSAFEAFRDQF
jgi:uncharacterized protein YceH (UPF0502 family)